MSPQPVASEKHLNPVTYITFLGHLESEGQGHKVMTFWKVPDQRNIHDTKYENYLERD